MITTFKRTNCADWLSKSNNKIGSIIVELKQIYYYSSTPEIDLVRFVGSAYKFLFGLMDTLKENTLQYQKTNLFY